MHYLFASIPTDLLNFAFGRIVTNDEAHTVKHVVEVAENARMVSEFLGYRENDKEKMILAALLHDIYSGSDRANHHVFAHDWVLGNLAYYGYEQEIVTDVALMCLEHRASVKGGYSSTLTEAFAAADRGKPDILPSLERSLKYHGFSKGDLTIAGVSSCMQHLKDKFGTGGYAKKNPTYQIVFADAIEQFNQDLNLDAEVLFEKMCERRW